MLQSNRKRGLSASRWATRSEEDLRSDARPRFVPSVHQAVPTSTADATSFFSSAPRTNGTSTPTTTKPKHKRDPSTAAAGLTPSQAFHRFEQACHRLRWKFIDLQNSYTRAMAAPDGEAAMGFSVADAERNFKVDFYEFYAWIEQALVLALGVFGVTISRWGGASAAGHAYHHNVLQSLNEPGNPLDEVMGQGDVNQALWKAKELRNRWKDAADGKETPALRMYDLTWIVGKVLGGLEGVYVLTAERVREEEARRGDEEKGDVEDGWEWMVEPMEWEA